MVWFSFKEGYKRCSQLRRHILLPIDVNIYVETKPLASIEGEKEYKEEELLGKPKTCFAYKQLFLGSGLVKGLHR